jgi:predicted site-specific integrase-resolvase
VKQFYTRKEAAEKLGVKPGTLAHWAWRGGIGPAFFIRNGRCIYPASSLVSYLHSLPVGGGVVADRSAAVPLTILAQPVTEEA